MRDDLPLWINTHDAAQCQPVLALIQRTDPIAQCPRQHRNHSVRQIDAGPPPSRLTIQKAVLPDIMGHIRNVDTEDVVPAIPLDGYCVIKILCILAIDRHHRHLCQIHAMPHVPFLHGNRDLFRLTQCILGKGNRHIVLAYHRQDIHTWIVFVSKDLNDLTLRQSVLPTIGQQAADHLLAVFRSHLSARCYVDLHRQPSIIRLDISFIAVPFIDTDHCRRGTADDRYDPRFLPVSPEASKWHNRHSIHVECATGLIPSNIIILFLALNGHEAEALFILPVQPGFRPSGKPFLSQNPILSLHCLQIWQSFSCLLCIAPCTSKADRFIS